MESKSTARGRQSSIVSIQIYIFLERQKSAFEEETKPSFYFHVAQDSLELSIADLEFLVLLLEINPCSKFSI